MFLGYFLRCRKLSWQATQFDMGLNCFRDMVHVTALQL